LPDLIFGKRLPGERERCAQFGVSRTGIRGALKAPARRGMSAKVSR
jgi:DNA-binding FadR family transcriptional regulator